LGDSLRRARGLPRAAWGMTLAHVGVGLVILGITASQTWTEEKLLVMKPGDTVQVGGYDFTFEGAEQVRGPNYQALRGTFTVGADGRKVTTMLPESRIYQTPPMETTEAAIRPTPAADLYAVVGAGNDAQGYAVRLYHKPLISWIWLGSFVMVLGGAVSLSDRRHRVGAPARRAMSPAAAPVAAGD
jgi:cytochrome c-type biogenesis protein CcmF